MEKNIVEEKFGIRGSNIEQEVTLQIEEQSSGRGGHRGKPLLIKDSEGNPILIINLIGEDVLYSGKSRVELTLPKDHNTSVCVGQRTIGLVPRET